MLRVHFPPLPSARLCQPGQYFLLRCGESWSPYLRQPLFPASIEQDALTFWGDPGQDAGIAWLAAQPDGVRLNLLGPLGRGFSLDSRQRRLLLVAESQRVAPLLALIGPQLDRQGSVGLLLQAPAAPALLPPAALPPAVEYYAVAADGSAGANRSLDEALPRVLQWADAVCAAGSPPFLRRLKGHIEQVRFGLQSGFTQVLAPVPLPCGVGACLACLVDTGRGTHRACVRGPVFDLVELAL